MAAVLARGFALLLELAFDAVVVVCVEHLARRTYDDSGLVTVDDLNATK